MSKSYAASVIEVLRPHFPDATTADADVLTWWIEQSASDRDPAGEFIVDDPMRANWRLKPDSADLSRVRLVCYRLAEHQRSTADIELERTVNEALRALERTDYEEG